MKNLATIFLALFVFFFVNIQSYAQQSGPSGSDGGPCPTITFTAAPTNTCNGFSTGRIEVSGIIGGTPPYTYSNDNGGAFQSSATFEDLASGTYQIVVKDFNDCLSAASPVLVEADSASLVDAGPDQTVCATDTIFLHATLGGVATNMVWQKNVAFGVFIGPDTNPDAKFLLNAAGRALSSIKFGAQSNDPGANVCQGGTDTVEIFINPAPTADAGADMTVCGAPPFPALNGTIGGNAIGGTWSGGGGTFSPDASTLNATYIPSASELANGTDVTLTLTATGPAGPCSTASDQMLYNIDQASLVDAGPDQTVCATDTIFLHATLGGVATNMVWQKNVAFGVFIGPDTNPDAKFLLNAAGRALSSIKFGAQSNDPGANVCQGGTDTVEIFINPAPTADAGADMTVCGAPPFPALNGTIGGNAIGGTWSGGGGTFSPDASTLNATYIPSASELANGTDVTLTLTATGPAGPCSTASDQMLYNIDQASLVDAGPDQTVCATDTIFLHATLGGVATNMVWQKNVAFGVFIGPDTNPDAKFLLNAAGRALSSIKFGAQSNDPGANVCQGGTDTVEIFINNPCVTNIIQNPGFESGTSPWVFFTNGTGGLSLVSPGASSPNAARVAITTTGNNMQLYQAGITLQPNTQYRLTFKALSSVGHNLTVSLARHVAPFTNYGLNNHLFDVTPSWATYTVDFTTVGFPPPTPSNARLRFAFNGYASPGDVYFIDDVSLVQLGSPLTATKVRVETAPDGGGSVVPLQTIENGNTITMYAISRTATDQFVANVSATWSLQDIVPNVAAGDLVPSGDGKSAVFTAHLDGSAKVKATSGGLTPVPSDVITVFTPPPVTNLLLNGGFESGTANWLFNTNGTGSFTSVTPGNVGAKAGQVTITTQGTIVQLYQFGVTLTSGNTYRLSFRAFSNTGHDAQVSVFKHGSPFTPYGLTNQFFNLTNTWASYSVDFTAGGFVGTVSDARLRFWFAPYDVAGDVYQFDDMKIELLPAPPDAENPSANAQIPTEFALTQNFPNPFNPSTTIIYTLPVDARVTLEVYDVLGQRVAQLVDGTIVAGYHDVVFDASALSSGLYLYRLTAVQTDGALFTKTEKMLLTK